MHHLATAVFRRTSCELPKQNAYQFKVGFRETRRLSGFTDLAVLEALEARLRRQWAGYSPGFPKRQHAF